MAEKDKKEPLSVDDKFELLLEVLARDKGPSLDLVALKEMLTATQMATGEAMRKAANPSNTNHPDISNFSKPKGERDDPKTALPFEFWYNGYPVHLFPETQHWREMELMAQVRPGEYAVIHKGGRSMKVTVTGERDANNKLTKVSVLFPVTREDKNLIPPQSVLLYQLIHTDNPKRRFLEAMQEHLMMTMGDVEMESVTA